MNVLYKLKETGRRALAPLIYRYPPVGLGPDRLYFYLHCLKLTRDVPGAVVEVGCSLGGTTVVANGFLKHTRCEKEYVCIDTFDGFVAAHFEADEGRGTPSSIRHSFSGNSKALVEQILRQHRIEGVKLIQGDITKLSDAALPSQCALVLADVDLVEPTRAILDRFWPRLASGGMMIVDDCHEQSLWKARIAYEQFCRDNAIQPRFQYNMGVLQAPARPS